MSSRSRPEMIGFRVTGAERKEMETVCEYENVNLAELCRSLVLPTVREKLRQRLRLDEGPEERLS